MWSPPLESEDARAAFFSAQEVLPYDRLFIGGQTAARSPALMKLVDVIVCANGQAPPDFVHTHRRTHRLPALLVHAIDLDDHTDEHVLHHIPEAIAAIHAGRRRGGALVHCTMGISRSATIVCAYLMVTSRVRLSEALEILQRARKWVRPNDGFMCQLRTLERAIFPDPRKELACNVHGPRNCPVLPTPTRVQLRLDDSCDLCRLERKTVWYHHTSPDFVIMQCDSCDCPLLVWRDHGRPWQTRDGVDVTDAFEALAQAAKLAFAPEAQWHFDPVQRSLPFHAHVHARAGQAPEPAAVWYRSLLGEHAAMALALEPTMACTPDTALRPRL